MQHQALENGRWAELTFPQQMANIGSETSRIYKALEAGKEARAESAFARFQELVDLTIKYGRIDASPILRSAMLEELCRLREFYCKAFIERNLVELAAYNRYLDHFALCKGCFC
ncbi:MAG: hypothetical protein IK045_05945 [Bacteroidales bacterium]|nr:hypothetical protein [Bacteroidales bacterium]